LAWACADDEFACLGDGRLGDAVDVIGRMGVAALSSDAGDETAAVHVH